MPFFSRTTNQSWVVRYPNSKKAQTLCKISTKTTCKSHKSVFYSQQNRKTFLKSVFFLKKYFSKFWIELILNWMVATHLRIGQQKAGRVRCTERNSWRNIWQLMRLIGHQSGTRLGINQCLWIWQLAHLERHHQHWKVLTGDIFSTQTTFSEVFIF